MQLTEQTSSDYVGVNAMGALRELSSTGIVPMWMGFTWVMSTRLLEPTPGTDIQCLFFTKRALGLHTPKDISARIAEDPSNSFAWRIYVNLVAGCVRVENKHIVQGFFADTV